MEQTELKRATGAAVQLKPPSSTSSAAPGSSQVPRTQGNPGSGGDHTMQVSAVFQRTQVLHCLWDSEVLQLFSPFTGVIYR